MVAIAETWARSLRRRHRREVPGRRRRCPAVGAPAVRACGERSGRTTERTRSGGAGSFVVSKARAGRVLRTRRAAPEKRGFRTRGPGLSAVARTNRILWSIEEGPRGRELGRYAVFINMVARLSVPPEQGSAGPSSEPERCRVAVGRGTVRSARWPARRRGPRRTDRSEPPDVGLSKGL